MVEKKFIHGSWWTGTFHSSWPTYLPSTDSLWIPQANRHSCLDIIGTSSRSLRVGPPLKDDEGDLLWINQLSVKPGRKIAWCFSIDGWTGVWLPQRQFWWSMIILLSIQTSSAKVICLKGNVKMVIVYTATPPLKGWMKSGSGCVSIKQHMLATPLRVTPNETDTWQSAPLAESS